MKNLIASQKSMDLLKDKMKKGLAKQSKGGELERGVEFNSYEKVVLPGGFYEEYFTTQ